MATANDQAQMWGQTWGLWSPFTKNIVAVCPPTNHPGAPPPKHSLIYQCYIYSGQPQAMLLNLLTSISSTHSKMPAPPSHTQPTKLTNYILTSARLAHFHSLMPAPPTWHTSPTHMTYQPHPLLLPAGQARSPSSAAPAACQRCYHHKSTKLHKEEGRKREGRKGEWRERRGTEKLIFIHHVCPTQET